MAEQTQGHELGWDDEITKDDSFVQLEPGDYPFTIDHYDRARHEGSEKIPPCNKAIVYFNIPAPTGETVQIREQFIMWSTLEWKLSELFRSVGLKKHGEPLKPDWNKLPGLTGRCKVSLDVDTKDPSKKYNHIVKFYDPEDAQNGSGYTAGKF